MTDPAYLARMQTDDGRLDPSEMVTLFEKGIQEVQQAVEGMTLEELYARPIPGKWSTLEVISHLADAEILFADRIQRTIAMDRPLLMGIDDKLYHLRLNYQDMDFTEQLALFTALRKHISRLLKLQPAESWARVAVHSESGLVTIRQILFQAIRHVQHHLPFIAEKRAALIG